MLERRPSTTIQVADVLVSTCPVPCSGTSNWGPSRLSKLSYNLVYPWQIDFKISMHKMFLLWHFPKRIYFEKESQTWSLKWRASENVLHHQNDTTISTPDPSRLLGNRQTAPLTSPGAKIIQCRASAKHFNELIVYLINVQHLLTETGTYPLQPSHPWLPLSVLPTLSPLWYRFESFSF